MYWRPYPKGAAMRSAGETPVVALHRFAQPLDLPEQRGRLAREALALGREAQLARGAGGQRQAERRLQLAQPHRQRRRRDVERPRRRAQRLLAQQGGGKLHVLDLDRCH
jgi:hypothetical protein